jgi:hypothetical protein
MKKKRTVHDSRLCLTEQWKERRLYRNALRNASSSWWMMRNVQRRLAAKKKELLNGLIHWITYNEWTKKNIQKYKTNFYPQPCLQEEIRISLPHLLHEAQAAQEICQIILLWYIEITEDHETLDISESET